MKGVNAERNFPFISTHPPRPIHRPGRMPGYLMAAPTAGPMAPPLPGESPGPALTSANAVNKGRG